MQTIEIQNRNTGNRSVELQFSCLAAIISKMSHFSFILQTVWVCVLRRSSLDRDLSATSKQSKRRESAKSLVCGLSCKQLN